MSNAASFSRVMTYEKCPAQYNYKYNLGLRDDGPGAAAARGTLIHSSIEEYSLGRGELHPEVPSTVKSHVDKLLDQADEVLPEMEFAFTKEWEPCEFEDEHCFVRGYMDNVYITTEAIIIDEYKTGGVYPEHDDQKALYALCGLTKYPQYETVLVNGVYIDKKKIVPSEYNRASLTSMRFMWERRISKLSLGIYPARPGLHCRWCPASKAKGGPCKLG